jgi:hypothetical protein
LPAPFELAFALWPPVSLCALPFHFVLSLSPPAAKPFSAAPLGALLAAGIKYRFYFSLCP